MAINGVRGGGTGIDRSFSDEASIGAAMQAGGGGRATILCGRGVGRKRKKIKKKKEKRPRKGETDRDCVWSLIGKAEIEKKEGEKRGDKIG